MRILITYHNFLRDYRGALLLAEVLKCQGHKVWIRAHWRNEIDYARIRNVDMIILGQISESSTYKIGDFSRDHGIKVVVNQSENVVDVNNYRWLFIYNNDFVNEDHIDLQNIATTDVYEFLRNTDIIREENKHKYAFTGFPRLDISVHPALRAAERDVFRDKYGLAKYKNVYLLISSFLFADAFDGMTPEDFEAMGINTHLSNQEKKLKKFIPFVHELIEHIDKEGGVLLIKRHPWDCSEFFEKTFTETNVRVLERNEYITPCLANSDVVLHEFSTTAVEAWLLNKPTYSLYLGEGEAKTTFNHLKFETIVTTFHELKRAMENETDEMKAERIRKSLEIFQPHIDGKATIKFAQAIDKLSSGKKVRFKTPFKTKLKTAIKDFLENRGWYNIKSDGVAEYSKSWDFINWENDKARVRRLYRKAIKNYIKENKSSIR